jgi:peptidoglycan/LPS O-acetylase OafA/YrhL
MQYLSLDPMVTSQSHLSLPTYRPDIDGLRAMAVLPVVAYHAFPDWVQGGFIGVDVFFVISGFLISTILFENLDRETFSFTEFYARRIKRIFPALILVLLASCAISWFVLLADEYKRLGRHIAAGAGFISNFVLWKEAGYFDASAETKPLLHLWSLAIEEQFYIVWPLLLWLLWKRKSHAVTLMLLITAASFSMNIMEIHRDAVSAFFSPITRFWELLSGSLLAWFTLFRKKLHPSLQTQSPLSKVGMLIKQPSDALTHWFSLIGLLLLLYGFTCITKQYNFPGLWALIPVVGAVLLISAGPRAWVNRTLLSNRPVVWLGLISFPLYLWHWPLLSFATILEGETPNWNIRVTVIVVSVFLSWLTFKFIEQNIRFGKQSAAKIPVLVILMALLCIVGVSTSKNGGWKFRLINQINEDIDKVQHYDWHEDYRRGTCFLDATIDRSDKFSDFCTSTHARGTPLVMLWGDSHAASLYKGLSVNSNKFHFNISQFTASGCPPVFDFDVINSKNCKELNSFVYNKIKDSKPDSLIMSGYWSLYDGKEKWEQLDFNKLELTINAIKKLGVKNIIIIGNLPTYTVSQTDMLKKRFRNEKINIRTYRNFNEKIFEINKQLEKFSQQKGIKFFNPLDFLCDNTGCMISLTNDGITPLAFDYGHLTAEGSIYLVSKFLDYNLIEFFN